MNSYLKNSIVIDRATSVEGGLFLVQDGDVLARLDGFVVVPIEKVPDLDAFLRSIGINADPSTLSI